MTDIPGWPWRPDLCPADLHYGEYLIGETPRAGRPPKILHVGTGLHHHVGLLLGTRGWRVFGMTVSRPEVEAYHALTNKPLGYGCFLLDVRQRNYEIDPQWAPVDSMSLFHLGEPPEPSEGMLTNREVIERALTWSREVVFYTRSSAWDRLLPLVNDLQREGKMQMSATYESLVAYRPVHG